MFLPNVLMEIHRRLICALHKVKLNMASSVLQVRPVFIFIVTILLIFIILYLSRLKDVDKEKTEKALRLGQTIHPYMIFVGEQCVSEDSVEVHYFYMVINPCVINQCWKLLFKMLIFVSKHFFTLDL